MNYTNEEIEKYTKILELLKPLPPALPPKKYVYCF